MSRAANHRKTGPAIDPDDDTPDTGAAAQQVKRIVPAAHAPAVVTTAPASVFAAGQAAKPKRAPRTFLDPEAVVIKSGVPLPPLTRGVPGVNTAKALLQRMQPGDMVEVLHRHANSISAQAKKDGIKVAGRKLTETHTGVWRL